MNDSGIPTRCVICDAELLNAHEITGLCRECKLVLRNVRGTRQADIVAEKQHATKPCPVAAACVAAKPGAPCRNTVQPGQPLPGRQVHHYRVEAPAPRPDTDGGGGRLR